MVSVGIDIATAGVRAIAVDPHGTVLAAESAPLPAPVRDDSGRSEQDAAAWWPATADVLRKVTATLPRGGSEVSAVAVSATSGTIVAVDAHGRPASPALMYDDRRAAAHNARAGELGAARWQRLAVTVSPTAALGRIAWLRANTPQAAGIRHTPEMVCAALTGHPVAADSSHALKSGYDALRGEWPMEVFDALDVPASWLPEVLRPTTVLGHVNERAAERTGLRAGTAVVAGMTDGCTAQLACGAVEPGQFVGILGTTYVLKGVSQELATDPTGAVYSHRHPSGAWLPGGASNTGGEALADTADPAALDEAAAAHGPAGCVAYPLRRGGERFPFVAPDARGFFDRDPVDEVAAHRARLEGVAFLENLALDHLRRLGVELGIDSGAPLLAAGGGNRSALWTRIRATVTGAGLLLRPNAESGYGAALLAAAAELPGGLADAAAGLRDTGTLVEPDPREAAALAESEHRFRTELYRRGWIDEELATP